MPPFLEFITPLNALIAYALASALWGASLLWRYLNHQPITRHRLVYTAWNVGLMGLVMTVGNAVNSVNDRGLMSPLAIAIVVVLFFAIFAGGSYLLERRWPEEPDAIPPKA